MKLNQVLAVEKGQKKESNDALTQAYHLCQKGALFAGLARTYAPADDDGQRYPAEDKKVTYQVSQLITNVIESLAEYYDTVATKDVNNCVAKADIVVDDEVLVADVPVTHLLFLEKQLDNLNSFVKKLPRLDVTENWFFDAGSNCYRTQVVESQKTKKVPRNHVKAEATEHHPAQVDVYYEDVVVGTWSTTKLSSAMPEKDAQQLLAKVKKLKEAVKKAREEANTMEIERKQIGSKVLEYLFD